jgi:membrane protein YdbS with pleckstrin-like domain
MMQLPIGAALAETFGQKSGKQGALAATLLLAVVWSSVMWFAAFAWLTGAPAWVLLMFVMVFALAYGVGLGLCGRYAQLALRVDVLEHPPEDPDTPAPETPSH